MKLLKFITSCFLIFSLVHCHGESSSEIYLPDQDEEAKDTQENTSKENKSEDKDKEVSLNLPKKPEHYQDTSLEYATNIHNGSKVLIQKITFEEVKAPDFDMPSLYYDEVLPYFVNISKWKLEELDKWTFNEVMDVLSNYASDYDIIPNLTVFTLDQIRSIPPDYMFAIDEFLFNFSKEQFKSFSPEQLKKIYSFKLENIKPGYISLLNADQVMALIPDFTAYDRLIMTDDLYKEIPISTMKEISQKDLDKVPWHILTNKEDFLYIFTKDAFDYKEDRISPEQISWLPLDVIEVLTYREIDHLSGEQLAAMSLEQLEVIAKKEGFEDNNWFSQSQIKAMSMEQLEVFKDNKKVNRIINFMKKGAQNFEKPFHSVNQIALLPYLKPEDFQAMTFEHALTIKEIKEDFLFRRLSIEQFININSCAKLIERNMLLDSYLTPKHVRSIPIDKVHDLDLKFLSKLDVDQVRSFLTYDQIMHFTDDQLRALMGRGKVKNLAHFVNQNRKPEDDKWFEKFMGIVKEMTIQNCKEYISMTESECFNRKFGCIQGYVNNPSLELKPGCP